MQRRLLLFAVIACGGAGTIATASCSSNDATPAAPDAAAETGHAGEGGGADAGADALEDVKPRFGRTLGLDINSAEDGNYIHALNIAKDAGVQALNLTIDWSSVETAADAGADGGDAGITYFNPNLHIANLVFADSAKVSFAFRAVDTTGPSFPADLAGKALDDPALVARYNAAQDYVFGEIPDLKLSMYVIGNEVDLPFGADAAKWTAYKAFFDATAAHARELRSDVKVGTVVTLGGAKAHRELVTPLLENADFLGLTYYPVGPDYAVQPLSTLGADLAAIVAAYPGKPIFLREAGYPASPTLGSSVDQQAAFVAELFRVWDDHADRIPLLTFFTMNDYSPQALDSLSKYYGSTDPRFLAYLGSLGLRTYGPDAGTDKPAWSALSHGAHARGW